MCPTLLSFAPMQCVGRALRGKTDYGIMVFADKVGNHTYQLNPAIWFVVSQSAWSMVFITVTRLSLHGVRHGSSGNFPGSRPEETHSVLFFLSVTFTILRILQVPASSSA